MERLGQKARVWGLEDPVESERRKSGRSERQNMVNFVTEHDTGIYYLKVFPFLGDNSVKVKCHHEVE